MKQRMSVLTIIFFYHRFNVGFKSQAETWGGGTEETDSTHPREKCGPLQRETGLKCLSNDHVLFGFLKLCCFGF